MESTGPEVTNQVAFVMPSILPYRIRVLNAVLIFHGMNITSTKQSSFTCAVFNLIFIAYTLSRLIKHTRVLSRNHTDFFALVNICRYSTYLISRINVLFHLKKLIKLYNLVVREHSAPQTNKCKLSLAIIGIPIILLVTGTLHFTFIIIVLHDQGIAQFLESYELIKLLPSQLHLGHRILAYGDPLLYSLMDVSWFSVVTLIKVLITYVISKQKKRVINELTKRVQTITNVSDLRERRSNWLATTFHDRLLNQTFEFSYFIWICCTFMSSSCLLTILRDGIYGHKSNINSIVSEVGNNLTEAAFILVTVYFDYVCNHTIDQSVHKLIEAESKSSARNDDLIELIQIIKNEASFNLKLYSTFKVDLSLVLKFLEALVPIAVIVIQLKR